MNKKPKIKPLHKKKHDSSWKKLKMNASTLIIPLATPLAADDLVNETPQKLGN
jgi:hypothetical protein